MRALAEEIARRLGCWRERSNVTFVGHDRRRPHTNVIVRPADGEGLNVLLWDAVAMAKIDAGTADAGTVIVMLLGWARRLRVDVGVCRECDGDGDVLTGVEHGGMQEVLTCPACAVDCEHCRGSGEVPGDPPSWANPWGEPPDPCPSCFGEGDLRPSTGRRVLSWEAAVLAAMPRWVSLATEPGAPAVGDEVLARDNWPRPIKATILRIDADGRYWIRAAPGNGGEWRHPAWSVLGAGDAGVREALSVAADAMQAVADPLGGIVTAWLSGSCPTCEGYGDCGWCGGHPARSALLAAPAPRHRRVAHADQAVHGVLDCPRCEGAGVCPACRGCGSVLVAFEADIRVLAAVRSDFPQPPQNAPSRAV